MSRLEAADFNCGEIRRYMEKLKQERQVTEKNIGGLERERNNLDLQIAELERRRDEVNNRLRHEQEIADKQDRAVEQADGAYQKIVSSSRSLAEYVKSEFHGTRRE